MGLQKNERRRRKRRSFPDMTFESATITAQKISLYLVPILQHIHLEVRVLLSSLSYNKLWTWKNIIQRILVAKGSCVLNWSSSCCDPP